MNSFTIEEVRAFQQVATEVYNRGKLLHGCGICYDLRIRIILSTGLFDGVSTIKCSYDIMGEILTDAECNEGLGPDGEMTSDRMAFLAFFCTMSEKDLLDYLNMD